jgi:hypothetical protein
VTAPLRSLTRLRPPHIDAFYLTLAALLGGVFGFSLAL